MNARARKLEGSRDPDPADARDPIAISPGAEDFSWRTFDPSMLPDGDRSPLAVELVTFRDHLDEMLKEHAGEFVVIKGTRIVGFHPDRSTAIKANFEQFQKEPVLVQQVVDLVPRTRLDRGFT